MAEKFTFIGCKFLEAMKAKLTSLLRVNSDLFAWVYRSDWKDHGSLCDDMLAKTIGDGDHCKDLYEIFAKIRKFNMCLNPEKCVFGV